MKPVRPGTAARAKPPVQREFRNNTAVFGWVFMLIWLGFLCLFSYIFLRDGGIPQLGIWGTPVMAFFWLFGMGGLSSVASVARVHISLGAEGLLLREHFLFFWREQRYRSRDISAPRVQAGMDSDGDRYYRCVLAFSDGRRVDIAEGRDQADVEAVCAQLQASLEALCRGYTGVSDAPA